MSPLEKYQSSINGLGQELSTQHVLPPDLEKLKFDILPSSSREHSVNNKGIRWLNNQYNSEDLSRMRRQKKVESFKIKFRYDPADIRKIWVYDSDNRCYYGVPIKSSKGSLASFVRKHLHILISLSEASKINKARRDNKKSTDSSDIESARVETNRIRDNAAKTTKTVRRKQEEKKESPVTHSEPKDFAGDQTEPEKDDSGEEFSNLNPKRLPSMKKLHGT